MGMLVEGNDAGTGIDGFVAYLRVDRLLIDRSGRYAVVRVSAFANKDAADQGKVIGQPVEHMAADTEPVPVLVEADPNVEVPEGEPLPEPHYEMSEPVPNYTKWFSPDALEKAHKDPFAQAYEWLKTLPQYKDAQLV